MSIDPYSKCLCGSGKKIKFCCGSAVIPDLEKIERALEGSQRFVAVDLIKRAIEKHGKLPALLSRLAVMQIFLGEQEAAREVAEDYLAVAPESGDAHTVATLLKLNDGEFEAAIDSFQSAVEFTTEPTVLTAEVACIIGDAAAARQMFLQAAGHMELGFILAQALGHEELAQNAGRGLVGMLRNTSVDPHITRMAHLHIQEADVEKYGESLKALGTDLKLGRYRRSLEPLQKLRKENPQEPLFVDLHALTLARLGREDEAVQIWLSYAEAESTPASAAIQRMAICSAMAPATEQDEPELIKVVYPIKDIDLLMERLLSDRRLPNSNLPANQFEGPPPRATFWVLDKEPPEADAEWTLDNACYIYGSLLIFGKQTDREARAEFRLAKDDEFWLKTTAAVQVLGEQVGPGAEETLLPTEIIPQELQTGLYVTAEVPPDAAMELQAAERRRMACQRWPQMPTSLCDGKKPAEVAGEEKYKLRLQGCVATLESDLMNQGDDGDLNELRELLKLPAQTPVTPPEDGFDELSNLELNWLDVSKIGEGKLAAVWQIASQANCLRLMGQLLDVGQTRAFEDFPQFENFMEFATLVPRLDKRLQRAKQAQEAAGDDERKVGSATLYEIELRLLRGEPQEFQMLVQQFSSRYGQDPVLGPGLMQLLVKYGLVRPDGTPNRPGGPPQPAAGPGPGEAAGQDGQIWTPDAPAADEAPKESKLWVPGMD